MAHLILSFDEAEEILEDLKFAINITNSHEQPVVLELPGRFTKEKLKEKGFL